VFGTGGAAPGQRGAVRRVPARAGPPGVEKDIEVFQTADYDFFIDFYFEAV
jgi:hypothetical protein